MCSSKSAANAPTLNELLCARYGTVKGHGLSVVAPSQDSVLKSILAHRSVRAYRPDSLMPGILNLILAAAQSAPSSSNLQAWSVVAVQDFARKARLAALCRDQRHIKEAPLFLIWLADLSRLRRAGRMHDGSAEGLENLESFISAIIDTTLAAQNAVVAAESVGLGTVFIGAIRNEPEKVAAELALPAEVFPVFGLVVGHPDPARPLAEVKPRLPQGTVLHKEIYRTESEAEGFATYDKILAEFQVAQKLPVTGWTWQVAQRVRDQSGIGTRARLAEAVAALGFSLR